MNAKLKLFKYRKYWGICDNDQAVLYEADFKKKKHAAAILKAHEEGAESFEDALNRIDPQIAKEIMTLSE